MHQSTAFRPRGNPGGPASPTPTLTEVLPPQKARPHNVMHWTATGPAAGTLVLDTLRARVAYHVEELPCPDGRAFRFTKADPTAGDPEGDDYTPFVGRVPQLDACDCRGFLFGRGKPCKHLLAARSLILNGWSSRKAVRG